MRERDPSTLAGLAIPLSFQERRWCRHILLLVKRCSRCATLLALLLFTPPITTARAAQDKFRGPLDKSATDLRGSDVKLQTAPEEPAPAMRQSARQSHVTGIRHWSTNDHTRVAIYLESEVAFASQRIPSPDRIVFDLANTKLASALEGRNFEVNDGFLKRIRVAQFQPQSARIVLEVHDLTEYDAFLLPDPHQLVIDIRNKEAPGRNALARQSTERTDLAMNSGDVLQSGSGADLSGDTSSVTSNSSNEARPPADPRVRASEGAQASAETRATVTQSGGETEDPRQVREMKLKVSVADGNARESAADDHASGATGDGQSGDPKSVSSSSIHIQLASPSPGSDGEVAANEKGNPRGQSPQPSVVASESSHPDHIVTDRTVKGADSLSVPEDYVIGEQDLLTVTIWKERDLSGSVVVRPDGKITVPLVGEIRVIGMKPLELQTVLTERLKPFVNVPQVTVAVNQINSRKVFLIGQVVKEGTFQISGSTTVLQIIAEAGGLRDFAKRKSIYILREQGKQQRQYRFNYEAVIRGRNREQNIKLEPGDTIVVP